MVTSMKTKTAQWQSRSRKTNEYWTGLGLAKGWCIYTAPRTLGEGYYIGETRYKDSCDYTPRRFGPFGSFDAARAAFVLMGDTLK